jgi:hypothetical protein
LVVERRLRAPFLFRLTCPSAAVHDPHSVHEA